MTDRMRIIVPLAENPVGKARPRVTKRGTYTPKKSRWFEDRVQQKAFLEVISGNLQPFIAGIPLGCALIFTFTQPKSWSKKRKRERKFMTSYPDLDNLGKAVLDALNGVCYYDDRQVVDLTMLKVYGDEPSVSISLWRKEP